MDIHSESFDAHVQIKTITSQPPLGDSKFKMHSNFRDFKILKNLKEGRKERRRRRKGGWEGSQNG